MDKERRNSASQRGVHPSVLEAKDEFLDPRHKSSGEPSHRVQEMGKHGSGETEDRKRSQKIEKNA